jgi:enoyl-CoA hydratase/carnithine racemase
MKVLRDDNSYRSAIDSLDAKEGTIAFAEKRKPNWQGR